MTNKEISEILQEIALLLEIKGENPFKVRAYQNGARVVDGIGGDVGELVRAGKLREMKGIGEGLSEKITEIINTGSCQYHQGLIRELPEGFLDLLKIQGLGSKRAKLLYDKLGIKSIGELEYACQENRLLALEGFGEKSQANILEAIKHYNKNKGYFLISQIEEESGELLAYLKKRKEIIRIEVAGSFRRKKELVRDIDVLVSTKNPAPVHEAFVSYGEVEQVLAKGETKSSVILKSGVQADLRTVTDQEFPYALYYFTGSKEHNVAVRTLAKRQNYKINEYGIFKNEKLVVCKNEEDIFKVLGLSYIPPELRENTGEIGIARGGKLPKLLEMKDIRGIFHVHSSYSDGRSTLEEMISAAEKMGYEFIGIAEHSKSAFYANGLSADRILAQRKEIDKLQKKYENIKIFQGIESEISGDGALDYPDRVLAQLDFVIGSVHSRMNLAEEEMTRRICRAMEHPAMTFLGHPTGRLLLAREGYAINYEKLFEVAKKNNVAIEINANPHRLDLDWRYMKLAKSMGLKMSINPDAHDVHGLQDVKYGVGIARKGWLEKSDVLNSMTAGEVEEWLGKRRL
ncbi:MAG: histidinol-phosphatase [Omnitrophica bacterium RIFCSPLOWO2_12_FULL_44_17]|uniref:DNA polymerase beta n=1 Tax=Candidatus Danuiimicrobium aquiferis TaxID=1801832 RepID=A0A1G1KTD4_9BACT|nr:MAG: histidinol-phosphatase [Omnitrophica bacterium RIFCSPHIGHO2_02_FULL_45_28]OGW91511.1 MAG: histidinol-phosphatase [Omnitrophica bacterium RIFCSPHIGHO2_12_FULL_44_12]OGW96105.1 MAG: histidinol-phosphatase [Omnitrophica bacterium RIFCSPLOWO2_12_FULL_44_17]OGX04654.1 MAG: histidinol-phosphatase [Omnitrophica bacterium RIFCSPLOWO2_02_FULL_44_11]